MKPLIRKLCDVQSQHVGSSTTVWQHTVVLAEARIGKDCNICAHVLIENDVVIGERVTVKSCDQFWDGLRIEDDVFIGPNVTFTNDPFPRRKQYPEQFSLTTIRCGASIWGRGNYSTGPDYWGVRHDKRRSCGPQVVTCGGGLRGQSRTHNQLYRGTR